MCRRAKVPFSPAWPRAQLIDALMGKEFSDNHNPIDNLRDGIMAFVTDYQADVQSQLTCPARTLDPKACYGCVDAKPLLCLLSERAEVQELIQVRRKPAAPPTKDTNSMPPTVRPYSSLEDLLGLKRWELIAHLNAVTQQDDDIRSAANNMDTPAMARLIWERHEFQTKGSVPAAAATAVAAPIASALPPAPPATETDSIGPVEPADAPLPANPVEATPAPSGKHSRRKAAPATPTDKTAPGPHDPGLEDRIALLEKSNSEMIKHILDIKANEAANSAAIKATLSRIDNHVEGILANVRDFLPTVMPKIEVLGGYLSSVMSVTLSAAELTSDLSPAFLLDQAKVLREKAARFLAGELAA